MTNTPSSKSRPPTGPGSTPHPLALLAGRTHQPGRGARSWRPAVTIEGADYLAPRQGPRTTLMIRADERCLPTDTGRLFSTGNHPLKTLLPMYHLHKAGLQFDVATVTGRAAKA